MNIKTRRPRIEEEGTLSQIWRIVFDDGDESAFFNYYFDPDLCIVATHGDIPIAAGYLLPVGNIICDKLSVPCAMIYGVATLPEYRNRGFAAAVVHNLVLKAYSAGFSTVVLCPSNDGLFEYYHSHTEFHDWFYIKEHKFKSVLESGTVTGLIEITPHDYNQIRKSLLADIPHIEPDVRALSYQKSLCNELGGGLLCADTPGGESCAIVERQSNGILWIKELLTPGGFEFDVIAAITSMFPAEEYVVRIPARRHNSQCKNRLVQKPEREYNLRFLQPDKSKIDSVTKRFGMLTAPAPLLQALLSYKTTPWFGLAFD